MKQCPVCDAPFTGMQCPNCGFDRSTHYECYPTLSPLSGHPAAVSRLYSDWHAFLRCPCCGGFHFGLHRTDETLICLDCRQVLTDVSFCSSAHTVPPGHTTSRQVRQIACDDSHIVFLYSDGTVRAFGAPTSGQCDVNDWTGITDIAVSRYCTAGLRKDGTVVVTCEKNSGITAAVTERIEDWSDIIALTGNRSQIIGVTGSGTICTTSDSEPEGTWEPEVSGSLSSRCFWPGIRSICAGENHIAGLRTDGSVVAVGSESSGVWDIEDWSDIYAIAAGGYHTVGLLSDGRVCAAGENGDNQCDVSDWSDIIAIAAGGYHTVGLCSDGTLRATGLNVLEQCNVSDWSSVIAIAAGPDFTIGLQEDGTILCTDPDIEQTLRILSR